MARSISGGTDSVTSAYADRCVPRLALENLQGPTVIDSIKKAYIDSKALVHPFAMVLRYSHVDFEVAYVVFLWSFDDLVTGLIWS
ncbi:hypothetical protein NPIL_616571 [Nephila pilipes]|uniref:Uncharacterized protein n=1 Tax=Nephila pilipes TaxID=299642 RepID=A0A8X6MZ29_NEPPI|nr:hypothetical protein NPIL_616571 [Nephila pilipes]